MGKRKPTPAMAAESLQPRKPRRRSWFLQGTWYIVTPVGDLPGIGSISPRSRTLV
jgi:hypothetical protein